jgi:serine/threonine protein kinase
MFAGYLDEALVGEGGLGRVYRAIRESTGGVVAIKQLHDVPSASPAWHRAKRELEAMLRLKGHPYVVSVEEIFESPTGPCLVMEYLEGGSLMQRIDRHGPLTTPEMVLVGIQVTQALGAAHEMGVVHRDIKPHNLLVGSFGQVKVADFGIAALTRQSGLHTRTQSFTLAYASPEELDGDEVGPPADVFSFAATMSHLATGKRPSFRDRSTARDLAELQRERPEIEELVEELQRCLAEDPARRPTMQQLHQTFARVAAHLGPQAITGLAVSPADALTAIRPRVSPQDGFPVPPPATATWSPTGAIDLRPTFCEAPPAGGEAKRRRQPILIPAATIAVLLGGAAVVVFGRDDPSPESVATTAATTSTVPIASDAATSLDTTISTTIDLSQIFPTSTQKSAPQGPVAGRLVTDLSGQHTGARLSATYSPNGTYLATTGKDAKTVIWTGDGEYVRTLIGHTDEVNSAVFSDDETQVLTASADGYAILWDLATGDIVQRYPHGGNVYSAVFSPDGSQVLTAGGDTRAVLWTIGGAQVGSPFVTNSGAVLNAVFNYDASRILTTGTSGDARLYTAAGDPIFPNFVGTNHRVSWGVFSPDGKYVLVATGHDNGAELWTIGHEYKHSYVGHTGQVNMAVFSPDGSQVLTASSDGTAMLFALDGTPLVTFAQTGIVRAATFSPDGHRVVTAGDNATKIWEF